jgi:hypothetical protein
MLVYGLVFWELRETVIAWSAMLALQVFTAAVAFRFDKEPMRPLWRLPLQQFAYRQLMYLVLMQSATTALTGGRLRWHKLHRAGLSRSNPAQGMPSGPVAPVVDTWPPVAGTATRTLHPASGRAVARPPLPSRPLRQDACLGPHDMPSAGSPPGGGSGPVFTG